MPENKIYSEIAITNAGASVNLPVTDIFNVYTVDGTGITLAGDVTISTSDTPVKATLYRILWNGNGLVKGGNNITIFGYALTAAQAAGKFTVEAYYDGSAFKSQGFPSFDAVKIVATANLDDKAVTTAKIDDKVVTTAKINDKAVDTGQIADAAIETLQIADAAITASKLDAQAANFSIVVPISFETGNTGSSFITYVEHNIKIVTVKSSVIKAIAATDAATIEVFLEGNSLGTLTIPLSSGQATQNSLTTGGSNSATYTSTPLQIRFQPAKTTPGGIVLVTLLCTRQF